MSRIFGPLGRREQRYGHAKWFIICEGAWAGGPPRRFWPRGWRLPHRSYRTAAEEMNQAANQAANPRSEHATVRRNDAAQGPLSAPQPAVVRLCDWPIVRLEGVAIPRKRLEKTRKS